MFMTRRTFVGLVAVAVAAVTCMELTIPQGYARDGDLRIRLTGAGGTGTARSRDREHRSEFQVEAEHLKLAADDVLHVLVDGQDVGTMKINDSRTEGQLELSTRRGQTVPVVKTGTTVSVVDQNGNVLMTGTF
jgi:hypothetical protein